MQRVFLYALCTFAANSWTRYVRRGGESRRAFNKGDDHAQGEISMQTRTHGETGLRDLPGLSLLMLEGLVAFAVEL